MKKNKKGGFTLLELLIVIAILAILSVALVIVLNPAETLKKARDAQRRADVNTILNAVYQYTIDSNGVLPTIPTGTCSLVAANQICKLTATGTCSTGVDLSVLTTLEKYLTSLPIDPTVSSTNGSGYYISKSANGRVTVCAPSAEQSAVISVTR